MTHCNFVLPALFVFFTLSFGAQGAGAQAVANLNARAEAVPNEYAVAIRDAVSDHDAGRFVEALAQFRRAHAIYPNARTLRGLGMVEFELRRYAESVRYLEQALTSKVRPLDGYLVAHTRDLLARARAYVGELQVSLTPSSAELLVDGAVMGSGPRASLLLNVGSHELEFRAHGYEAGQRTVTIQGGEQKSLSIELAPESPAAQLAEPPNVPITAAAEEADERRRPRWWLWPVVGASLVAIATSAYFVAQRGHDEPLGPPVVMTLVGGR